MTGKQQVEEWVRSTFGVEPQGSTIGEVLEFAQNLAKAALAGVNPSAVAIDPEKARVERVVTLLDMAGLKGNSNFIRPHKAHLDNLQVIEVGDMGHLGTIYGFEPEVYRDLRASGFLAKLGGALEGAGYRVNKLWTSSGARMIATRPRQVEQNDDTEIAYG